MREEDIGDGKWKKRKEEKFARMELDAALKSIKCGKAFGPNDTTV